MTLTAEELQMWARQEAAARARVEQSVQLTLWSMWASFGAWYSQQQVTALASRSVAIVQPARQAVGDLGAAYMREVIAGLTAVRDRAPSIQLPDARLGADLIGVYSRPAEAFRMAYALTEDTDAALEAAHTRLDTLARDDLLVARRDGEHQQMQSSGVTHYRRIVHPELSETGVCGLCLAAADRVYSIEELLPIHDKCQCTVAPESDAATAANQIDLERIYKAAGGTTDGRALKAVRFQVNEHGELGPVLGVRGHRFQRQGEAPKGDPVERAAKELRALEPVLDSLQRRSATGENVADPLAYQLSRIEKLRRIVAAA